MEQTAPAVVLDLVADLLAPMWWLDLWAPASLQVVAPLVVDLLELACQVVVLRFEHVHACHLKGLLEDAP